MTPNLHSLARSAEEIDAHVGARVRALRQLAGLSQQALADAVGITFQQIQKYERGANRISASKLLKIAGRLNVPISALFQGLEPDASGDKSWLTLADQMLSHPAGADLARAFVRIRRGPVKRRLAELAEAVADRD